MKIFYITSVLGDSGGSEIYTRDLLMELQRRGHELCVYSTERYELKGVKMVFAPSAGHHAFRKFFGVLSYFKALKAAQEFKPDLVQSHSNSMMGLIGHFLKRKLKVPHVMLVELISSRNLNIHTKTIFELEKFFLPKLNYDKIVVWTENMKKNFLLKWNVPAKKIVVQPAAIELRNYTMSANGASVKKKYGEHLITSIKTLWGTNAEGLKYVIEAMKYVKEKHPEYKYVVFGDGNYRKMLEEFAIEKGVSDVVKFAGAITPEQAREVWAATEIAPHSFVYEFSTSVSLLEYMAAGKACVVTDIGSVQEFVGNAALVVKPNDAKAMAAGINKLIEDKKKRTELGAKARKLVEERYSIKATVDRLEQIYSELKKR